MEFARACVEGGRADEAVAWAEGHVASDPKRAFYRFVLAIVYSTAYRHDACEAQISEAIRLDPGNEEFARQHALMRQEAGDHEGAVTILHAAIGKSPKNVMNYVGLVQVHDRHEDYKSAADACRSALIEFPINPSFSRMMSTYDKAAEQPETRFLPARVRRRAMVEARCKGLELSCIRRAAGP